MPGARAAFPKSRRLLRAQEFRTVLGRAPRLRSAFFTAAFDGNGIDHPRLGITVSRRVALRATARNRIRRIVRETFRSLQHQLPATDIVVLAAKNAADAGAPALRAELEQLFRRIGRARANAGQTR